WLESQRPPTPRRRVRPSGWDVPPPPRGPAEVWKCTPSSPDAGDDPTTAEDVDSDSDGEDLFEQLDPESQVPGAIQASVDSMMWKMDTLFPSEMRAERRARARTALEESFKRANEEYTLESAVEAAGNFEFDKEALARDLREFEACEGNLEKMIRERRRQRSGSRLSARRVHECISADNPEREMLLAFAEGGVRVSDVTDPDTELTGADKAKWQPLRATYRKAAKAVNLLISEGFHKPGLAIILPVTAVRRLRDKARCNVFTTSWTFNTGKELGRPTADPRNLNGDYTKKRASELWGRVRHPTIRQIVEQINCFLAYCAKQGRSAKDCSMWKVDVKGAYTLQDYASE
ncbi:hypothetical protein B484DRAFT_462431, partial [Ochromonadaceae sp. CCMP2298]